MGSYRTYRCGVWNEQACPEPASNLPRYYPWKEQPFWAMVASSVVIQMISTGKGDREDEEERTRQGTYLREVVDDHGIVVSEYLIFASSGVDGDD